MDVVGWTLLWCWLPIALGLGCGATEPTGPTTAPAAEPIEVKPIETEPNDVTPVPSPPAAPEIPSGFLPTHIEVLPLTELVETPDGLGTQLNVYVAMLDAFGEKVKAPGTLRFELYDYVQRSAEPKGQRIAIWPDIDLNDPAENQKCWRDFLRAYEFVLGTQASRNKTYILEVTCLCSNGKRLSTEWPLKPEK